MKAIKTLLGFSEFSLITEPHEIAKFSDELCKELVYASREGWILADDGILKSYSSVNELKLYCEKVINVIPSKEIIETTKTQFYTRIKAIYLNWSVHPGLKIIIEKFNERYLVVPELEKLSSSEILLEFIGSFSQSLKELKLYTNGLTHDQLKISNINAMDVKVTNIFSQITKLAKDLKIKRNSPFTIADLQKPENEELLTKFISDNGKWNKKTKNVGEILSLLDPAVSNNGGIDQLKKLLPVEIDRGYRQFVQEKIQILFIQLRAGLTALNNQKLINMTDNFNNKYCIVKEQYIYLNQNTKIFIEQWQPYVKWKEFDELDKIMFDLALNKENYWWIDVISDRPPQNSDNKLYKLLDRYIEASIKLKLIIDEIKKEDLSLKIDKNSFDQSCAYFFSLTDSLINEKKIPKNLLYQNIHNQEKLFEDHQLSHLLKFIGLDLLSFKLAIDPELKKEFMNLNSTDLVGKTKSAIYKKYKINIQDSKHWIMSYFITKTLFEEKIFEVTSSIQEEINFFGLQSRIFGKDEEKNRENLLLLKLVFDEKCRESFRSSKQLNLSDNQISIHTLIMNKKYALYEKCMNTLKDTNHWISQYIITKALFREKMFEVTSDMQEEISFFGLQSRIFGKDEERNYENLLLLKLTLDEKFRESFRSSKQLNLNDDQIFIDTLIMNKKYALYEKYMDILKDTNHWVTRYIVNRALYQEGLLEITSLMQPAVIFLAKNPSIKPSISFSKTFVDDQQEILLLRLATDEKFRLSIKPLVNSDIQEPISRKKLAVYEVFESAQKDNKHWLNRLRGPEFEDFLKEHSTPLPEGRNDQKLIIFLLNQKKFIINYLEKEEIKITPELYYLYNLLIANYGGAHVEYKKIHGKEEKAKTPSTLVRYMIRKTLRENFKNNVLKIKNNMLENLWPDFLADLAYAEGRYGDTKNLLRQTEERKPLHPYFLRRCFSYKILKLVLTRETKNINYNWVFTLQQKVQELTIEEKLKEEGLLEITPLMEPLILKINESNIKNRLSYKKILFIKLATHKDCLNNFRKLKEDKTDDLVIINKQAIYQEFIKNISNFEHWLFQLLLPVYFPGLLERTEDIKIAWQFINQALGRIAPLENADVIMITLAMDERCRDNLKNAIRNISDPEDIKMRMRAEIYINFERNFNSLKHWLGLLKSQHYKEFLAIHTEEMKVTCMIVGQDRLATYLKHQHDFIVDCLVNNQEKISYYSDLLNKLYCIIERDVGNKNFSLNGFFFNKNEINREKIKVIINYIKVNYQEVMLNPTVRPWIVFLTDFSYAKKKYGDIKILLAATEKKVILKPDILFQFYSFKLLQSAFNSNDERYDWIHSLKNNVEKIIILDKEGLLEYTNEMNRAIRFLQLKFPNLETGFIKTPEETVMLRLVTDSECLNDFDLLKQQESAGILSEKNLLTKTKLVIYKELDECLTGKTHWINSLLGTEFLEFEKTYNVRDMQT